jgi:DNA-binding transcriptional regulator GbsR (MarR family)
MYFPHRSPVIKFRLAESFVLDYSDFRDEGLRVAIFARSGGGKSNLAALFAEEALEQGLQTLIIEPLREYNTLKKLYDVVWVAKGGDLPLVTASPEPYVKLLERGANMVFTAKSGNLDERRFVVGLLWSLYEAWDAIRRPLLLIVEEADRYAPQIADRETRPLLERMLDLAKQGRKLGITLILVTHRPADINKSVVSEMNVVFIGGFRLPHDLRGVREMSSLLSIDIPTGDVARLSPGQFYAIVGGEVRKITAFRRKTPHGGETPQPLVGIKNPELAGSVSEMATLLEMELRKAEEESNELNRLRHENMELRREIERLRKELEVTKIVKEVPMEIKAVVDSPPITSIPSPIATTTTGVRDNIPEAVLTCKHPGAVKVYLYLANNPGKHTLAEISSATGLGHESVKRVVKWMKNKGLASVRTRRVVGRPAIRYVGIRK